MIAPRVFRIVMVAGVAGAFATVSLVPFPVQAGGKKLGPDKPLQLAQDKGKGGNGDKGKGEPPFPPPGLQKNGATPAVPTDHESGVHGANGRNSAGFGTPSGLRGTREVPEGR